MEKFKEKILKRTILMALIATLLTISYLVLFYKQNALPQIPDFIKGFQTGAFIGVDVILIRLIIKNIRSMKNENSLKKLYIEENDERKLMIMQNLL